MFDIDRFAADCRAALAERGSDAIREVVRRAVSEPSDIIAALGEQRGAFADILVRSSDLTILNVVWGTRQWTLPHNHHYRAIIGMYGGAEDNIYWRRLPGDVKGRVEAAGAASLRHGEVTVLGRDIIHSVTNLWISSHTHCTSMMVTSSPQKGRVAGTRRRLSNSLTMPRRYRPCSVRPSRAGKEQWLVR